ncbi:hypothetical protein DLP3_013 [Stenotrophomonas phage vB_SmaS_DLP_3]|nr:hypothetical protein DLP3_013 [Stenotrophomonas phage vB_SmaS_DLP_3]
MADKEKTVEVTLSKRHHHNGVEHQKGDVIEVTVSDLPLLEDFKVVEEGSVAAVGTHQAKLDAEKKAAADAFEARIKAIDAKIPDKTDAPKPEVVKVDTSKAQAPATEIIKTPVTGVAGDANKESK